MAHHQLRGCRHPLQALLEMRAERQQHLVACQETTAHQLALQGQQQALPQELQPVLAPVRAQLLEQVPSRSVVFQSSSTPLLGQDC